MNSVQINCFLAAAKYRSFSRAAASLYISQPTFSRNIASMEEELGVRLFSRNSFHGIVLTAGGKRMLEAFTHARKEVLAALEEARRLEREARLHMTIGLLEGQLLDETLEDLLSRFRLSFPNVTMNIQRDTYQDLMARLHADDVDVAYMPQWQFRGQSGLTVVFIGEMETVLVVPKRLIPDVENQLYSLTKFQAYPFITVKDAESSNANTMLFDLFSSLGVAPPVYEAKSMREQIEKVEMGEGMILINPNNSVCYSPNVNCVRIKELLPQPFAIAWKQHAGNECVTLFHRFLQTDGNMRGRKPQSPESR